MVLGLAQEQQRDAPARIGGWTSLTAITCTLPWGFIRPALELAVILCCARPWSAFCCKLLSRRRASPLWTCCSSSARCS